MINYRKFKISEFFQDYSGNICRINNIFASLVFVSIVPLVAHLLFSQFGFNPTDDGFILAGSRRLLDGQIPHKDFISIRPALSHYLHIPFILMGGNSVIMLSRWFVWFQFGYMAWIWTAIISQELGVFNSLFEKYAIAFIAFCFSAHYFPIMVWHTIDALFFSTIGLMVLFAGTEKTKLIGYIIIGTVPLFRLNFLPLIPLTFVLFNDWRKPKYYTAAAIPLVLYVAFIALNGAGSDLILQLTTHTGIFDIGFKQYLRHPGTVIGFFCGILAAVFGYSKVSQNNKKEKLALSKLIGIAFFFLLPIGAFIILASGKVQYFIEITFLIYASTVGISVLLFLKEFKINRWIRLGIIILGLAWCASISVGYNTPALALGPVVIFSIGALRALCMRPESAPGSEDSIGTALSQQYFSNNHKVRSYLRTLTIILLIITLISFGATRLNYLYRDDKASELEYDLGEVLPGGNGIKTNNNTYYFLKDLNDIKSIAKQRNENYCIIPDISVNWIKESQSNPLSADWPQDIELASTELRERVVADIESLRGNISIITQKYEAYYLSEGLLKIDQGDYFIVDYVRSNFNKTADTDFFELYE
jgi:hypothetical protein